MRLANIAAGIVVGKQGAATVTVAEMEERMRELVALAAVPAANVEPLRPGLRPLDLPALVEKRGAGAAATD